MFCSLRRIFHRSCLLGGLAFACTPAARTLASPVDAKGATVDGIAAYVNHEAITISDVLGGVRVYLNDPAWLAGRTRENAFRAAYAESLGQLVNQRLILQEYRSGEARLPGWLVEKRMAEILDNRFQGDRASLLRELGNERMVIEDWKARIEEQMIVGAMRQSQVDANVRVTPAQIRAHYHANTVRYTQPAGVRLGLILIRAKAGDAEEETSRRARAAAARLDQDESFEEVARELSDDSAAAKGGDWGWIVPEEILRDDLTEVLRSLNPGQTSAPVQTPAGFFILRKQAEREAGTRPLEEVQDQIERELSAAESQRLFLSWISRLRSKANIKTFGEFAENSVGP